MVNPLGTLTWLQGVTLSGVAAALLLLVRVSIKVGKMTNQVETMWWWFLSHVGKLEVPRTEDDAREKADRPPR
jgi:hypothetical protein